MTIAVSHGGGSNIIESSNLSSELLVGSIDGVIRLVKRGSDWIVSEKTLEGNHVHALVQEPQSGIWFCGVEKGGIFASEDDGHTWIKRDVGLAHTNVYSLSVSAKNGKTYIYAGTEPAHLFVSDDLGLTWIEKPALHGQETDAWKFPAPPHVAHLKHISFHPANPAIIFASIEQGGLYRSDDGGDSFEEIKGMYNDVHRLITNPDDPSRMFVTGGEGLWLSKDTGLSWENIFSRGSEYGGYPDQLVFQPSNPSCMIVTAGQKSPGQWHREGTAETRISRSTDAGETWEVILNGLNDKLTPSIEAMTLEESNGVVQIFAATSHGELLWSEDAGESWNSSAIAFPPVSKGNHYEAFQRDVRHS